MKTNNPIFVSADTKMGFDISIELVMMMCPIKGKPFYYTNCLEKVYGIPDIEVPEHLAQYLQGRGHHYLPYIEGLADDGPTRIDVLLEAYPSFEEVQKHHSYEDYWTEGDHELFKELLTWCHEQRVSFQVSWSY